MLGIEDEFFFAQAPPFCKVKNSVIFGHMTHEKDGKVPEIFLKPYDPTAHETAIYTQWEESGYFNPDVCVKKGVTPSDAEAFTIVLPPPNVTGTLHMGHAAMLAIEDTLIRHARMQGKRTLWLPGTDSAAIATQSKVEKEIQKKEKKSRYDLGREELLNRIDVFVEESKSTILSQVRAMGGSLDWSRYAYTMDDPRYRAVMEAFVRMYKADLIYRADRIVNWDPKGQTTISDDEIIYEERTANLYTFKYWKDFPISISTTRPETKVGDTAVAVHPDDERYAQYVGKTFTGEFAGAQLSIKIVADPSVEKEFGTGALGVTPAHSHIDWEIADRHELPRIQVIDERARMTEAAGALVAGLKVGEAREKIVDWLRAENLLEAEESVKQNVSTAERTGAIIEPLPKLQWWINVNKPFPLVHSEIEGIPSGSITTLKEIMHKVTENGQITIMPERFTRIYSNWIDNLRDWCISRQIWFGHRIPVWYRGEEMYCGVEAPVGDGWVQDEDVLDTWFSSGLWTFSTLGWPDETEDMKTYHPTTVLETGYDIIFFWVARMILMSGFFTGQIPFKYVYLHGLVRDAQGRKMSKSLGNIIDPLTMIEKYGADATRLSLITGVQPGNDLKLSEDRIRGYKNFANKVWNISRFVLTETTQYDPTATLTEADAALLSEARAAAEETAQCIEKFRLDLAVDCIYHYVWDRFAAQVLEESKAVLRDGTDEEKASRQRMLYENLVIILKTLHPFMPFVTETIWQHLPEKENDMLVVASWPSK